jgi:hypothetical protein
MNNKARLQRRFSSRCQLSVLVQVLAIMSLVPLASAKKACASENPRLSLKVYNPRVTSPFVAPSGACFTGGFMLTGRLSEAAYSATAGSPQTSPKVTIHVYNYASLSLNTLIKAEKGAARIFGKAGVETGWLNRVSSQQKQENSIDQESFHPSDILVNILNRSMAESFHLPAERMGFVPGGGHDRHEVYVFYQRVEELAQQGMQERQEQTMKGTFERHANIGEVLGHVIAHELGHLLGLDSHSVRGLMRPDWNLTDLKEAADGYLLFTPHQAHVIRSEVNRRVGQQESMH